MTENAVRASPVAPSITPKEESFGARHKRSFAVAIIIGVLMAVLAPLQTNHIPFLPRLGYWQILMVSGATLGLGVTELIERWGQLRRWPWLEVPVIGIFIALPLTMIVIGSSNIFFGTSTPGVIRFSYNFGITALISTAITALMYALENKHRSAPIAADVQKAPQEQSTVERNRFTERLPLQFRAMRVLALQAEDHYLRVHLEDGQSTLILMRLSDAIAELPDNAGAQTHRSWWVAKGAVSSVTKSDGRAILTLEGGSEAPVSRSFYKALGQKGWLV